MWPNPQFPADLVTFTQEIPNGKLYFLCSFSWFVVVFILCDVWYQLNLLVNLWINPVIIYLFKFNYKSTRKWYEICAKSIIKSPKRRPTSVNSYFWTYLAPFCNISIVDFEQVNVYREGKYLFNRLFKNHLQFLLEIWANVGKLICYALLFFKRNE